MFFFCSTLKHQKFDVLLNNDFYGVIAQWLEQKAFKPGLVSVVYSVPNFLLQLHFTFVVLL